ncbi:MAG: hypothetical protein J5938_03910 [Clostridia bacterium]|nr:hypothetical protein [Clostridia bacterium]MBQ4290811.1 hypothetical protein [Clostridia bacterium]
MSASVNFAEYHYEKRKEGPYKIRLIVGRALCILVGLLPILLPAINVAKFGILLIPAMVIFGFMLYFQIFVGKLLSIEYSYTVDTGIFKMDQVNGRGKHKELLSVRVRDMSIIAPYTDDKKAELDACEKVYDCSISMTHPTPDIYYCIFDLNGTKTACVFEATNKVVSVMKFYNADNLIIKKDLRY